MAMGDTSDQIELVKAELHIYMHCPACEKRVLYVLYTCEGVETVKSSLSTHEVVVTGQIDMPKLVRRVERKTHKKVIVVKVIRDEPDAAGGEAAATATAEEEEEEEEEEKALAASVPECVCYSYWRSYHDHLTTGCGWPSCRSHLGGHFIPNCGCLFCRPNHHGYCHAVPIQENDVYPYCSIM